MLTAMQPGLALTVLARAPVAGSVKTRLARSIGDDAAAALHEALALDVLERLAAWARRVGARELVLALTGDAAAGLRLADPAAAWGWRAEAQPEGDLGARIEAGLARRLEGGSEAALVLGTDAPILPDALLDEAVSFLASADVVLAAAADGGFVLIGARRWVVGALDGVPWGTPGVLRSTLAAAARSGLTVEVVGVEDDVDDLESLARLAARPEIQGCPRTAAWLASWRGGPGSSDLPSPGHLR